MKNISRHCNTKNTPAPISLQAKVIDSSNKNSRVLAGLGTAMLLIVSLFAFSCASNNTVGTEPDMADELSLPSAALSFDGSESYVDTGVTASDLGIEDDSPKTIEAWVYAREFQKNAAVFSLGERMSSAGEDFSLLALNVENQWRMVLWNIDLDFYYPSKGQWVHFACVYTGSEMVVYADGKEVARAERDIDTSAEETLRFGHWHDEMGNSFEGMISEARVWNRALSSEEVNANMDITLEGDEDGLSGYWPMGEEEGEIVYDKSPGNNHGLITGASWGIAIRPPALLAEPPEKVFAVLSETAQEHAFNSVRRQAIRGLAGLNTHTQEVKPVLLAILEDAKDTYKVRLTALNSLLRIDVASEEISPALMKILGNP